LSSWAAAAGFAVTPPGKWSVMDLSFHLQSPANHYRERCQAKPRRNPNQRRIHYDADHTHLIKGMTINFNNLIVGRHESKILFLWNPKEGVAMLGAFLGIKDGIDAILSRDRITPAQRAILEEFRAIAGKNNWDFATLRESLS
jgi:hypothetical protein